jgi:hypothetical protein
VIVALEICIIVDERIAVRVTTGKADAVIEAEGNSPECARASAEDTTGVEERGMNLKG